MSNIFLLTDIPSMAKCATLRVSRSHGFSTQDFYLLGGTPHTQAHVSTPYSFMTILHMVIDFYLC